MSGTVILDAALSALCIANGLLALRQAKRGSWARQEFVSLGKNPVDPEGMTPRMRRFTRVAGIASLFVGALGILITIYRSLHA